MKKLVLILVLMIVSLTVFTQKQYYAYCTSFKFKPSDTSAWSPEVKINDKLLMYIDFSEAIVYVQSSYSSTYLLEAPLTEIKLANGKYYVIFDAIDKHEVDCQISLSIHPEDKMINITILYNGVYYSYDANNYFEGVPVDCPLVYTTTSLN